MEKSENVTEEKIGYRQILTQKEYCKLIVANLINRFGDSIDAIAFTWLVYQVTGSASWSAVIYALNVLPSIFVQPLAGAAVEKRSKKKLMVLSDMIRGVVVVVLALTYVKGVVNPWLMAAFTLTISTVEAFCVPASSALIPKILEKKYYEFGTGLNSAASSVMQIAGTAVAGVIIGFWGIGTAIFIDAVTFFASAVIKMFLHVEEHPEKGEEKGSAAQRYMQTLKEGFSYVKDKRVVRNFCMMSFIINATLVPINALQAPLIMDVLGAGSELMSVQGIATVAGMGIGSLLFPYLSKRCSVRNFLAGNGIGLAISFGAMTWGSFFPGNMPAIYAITAAASFTMGFFCDLMNCILGVQFMKCVQEDYMARASALMGAGSMAAMPLTSFVISIMVKFVSVKAIMNVCSILCVSVFIVVLIMKTELEEEDENENENCLEQAD